MTMRSSLRSELMTRRTVLVGGAAAALASCAPVNPQVQSSRDVPLPPLPDFYAAMPNERFPVPAVNPRQVEPRWWRTVVPNRTGEPAGTLVVDTPSRYLYFTQPGGTAMRYGIGVGRAGFAWEGRARVAYKRKWPRWTPPDEMVAREPELEPYSIANGGMDPGPENPLGARALYIFQNGEDTLYRLHGTPQQWTIGTATSSGCIRLLQQDVADLYERVSDGTPIVVNQDPALSVPSDTPVDSGAAGLEPPVAGGPMSFPAASRRGTGDAERPSISTRRRPRDDARRIQ